MLLVMRVLSIVPLNFKVRPIFFCFCFGLEGESLRRFYDDQNRTTTHTKTDAHILHTAYAVVCSTVSGIAGVQFVCAIAYPSAEDIIRGNLVEHASSE
jgi:hypothetical protein